MNIGQHLQNRGLALLIALMIFLYFCLGQNSDSKIGNTRIFKSRALQDSLEMFNSTVKNIPNYYNAPTLTLVLLSVRKDTVNITFLAECGMLVAADDGPDPTFRGACKVKNRTTLFYVYSGEALFKNMIRFKLLKMKEEEYNFFKTYNGPRGMSNCHQIIMRKYIYHSKDSIELVKKSGC